MRYIALRRLALVGACMVFLAGCGGNAGQPARQRQEPQAKEADAADKNAGQPAEAEENDSQPKETKGAGPAGVQTKDAPGETPADGVYTAEFETDSSMFHLNESCGGRATLLVKDGVMNIHIPLVSKSIVNLFSGTAEEARAADESQWLKPVTEMVTYSDGYTEEVYAFDVPVPAIGTEFPLALIGKKGKWYDHTVCVRDPQPVKKEAEEPENGVYRMEVLLSGGSGRAGVESPAKVTVSDEGIVATLVWSSPYYDYMIVDGVRYEPVSSEEHAVFEIPVAALDEKISVTADTVAMSVPHEIDYTITVVSAGAQKESGG